MRRRVAIVSSCCPPLPGHPVTGGGLRTAQLIETVRDAGHTPVLLLEAGAIPEGVPAAISRAASVSLSSVRDRLCRGEPRSARTSVRLRAAFAVGGRCDRPWPTASCRCRAFACPHC